MQLSEGMQLIEKTWNHTQNQKKGYIFGDVQQAYYLQVLVDFIEHREKTNRVAVLSSRPLLIFLNTGTTDQTFQQSGIEIPSDKYWRVQLGVMNI